MCVRIPFFKKLYKCWLLSGHVHGFGGKMISSKQEPRSCKDGIGELRCLGRCAEIRSIYKVDKPIFTDPALFIIIKCIITSAAFVIVIEREERNYEPE